MLAILRTGRLPAQGLTQASVNIHVVTGICQDVIEVSDLSKWSAITLVVSKMGDDLVPFASVMVLRRFIQRYLHIRV